MTFGNIGGFYVDITGPAGDLMYGLNDNYYDPCPGVRVTVGVGVKVPVVVSVSVGVVPNTVGITNPNSVSQSVQITAQTVSVGVSQPAGASNPVRQEQNQNLNQPQVIQVVPVSSSNEAMKEFADGARRAGVTVLTPKVADSSEAIKSGILLKDAARILGELSKEVAVDVHSAREFSDFMASGSDEASRFVQGLYDNRDRARDILQKSGFSFDETKQIIEELNKGQIVKNNIVDFVRTKIPSNKIFNGIQNTMQQVSRQLVSVC